MKAAFNIIFHVFSSIKASIFIIYKYIIKFNDLRLASNGLELVSEIQKLK